MLTSAIPTVSASCSMLSLPDESANPDNITTEVDPPGCLIVLETQNRTPSVSTPAFTQSSQPASLVEPKDAKGKAKLRQPNIQKRAMDQAQFLLQEALDALLKKLNLPTELDLSTEPKRPMLDSTLPPLLVEPNLSCTLGSFIKHSGLKKKLGRGKLMSKARASMRKNCSLSPTLPGRVSGGSLRR